MPAGSTTTYDLTVGIMLDMDPMIQLLDPADVPLQGGMGADPGMSLPSSPCYEKKVEWMDENLLTPRSSIAATTTTGDGWIVVASGEKFRFQTGDVVLVGSEYMRVTGYGSTTDTLTVTRAYSGTAATVATSAVVVGVGSALPEGSDPPTARFLDRTARFNHTEIFGPYKVQSSLSDLAIRKYGISNEMDHQTANRVKEAGIAQEQSLIYGVRVEDTTNKWRTMNGIMPQITTNIDTTTTTSITETAELAQLQTIFDAGGGVDVAMMGSKQKRIASSWTSSGVIQVQRPDGTRGTVVTIFESDFGNVALKLNRWMKVSDLVNFSRDQAIIRKLRPLTFTMLAQTGDAYQGMIVSEMSLEFVRQRHAGKFTALT